MKNPSVGYWLEFKFSRQKIKTFFEILKKIILICGKSQLAVIGCEYGWSGKQKFS